MRRRFLLEYIRHIRTVGSITPSSSYLANKMIRPINFETAKVIVQFGPGAGTFTDALLRERHDTTALLLIELNEQFYAALIKKYAGCPNVYIHNGSAETVAKVLSMYKLPKQVDYIISGLPFASLPRDISNKILDSARKVLKPKGVFVTFQYTLFKKTILQSKFKTISVQREWLNIPPAYILLCRQQ